MNGSWHKDPNNTPEAIAKANAEMDAYLAGFDARRAAEQAQDTEVAETAAPTPAPTKVVTREDVVYIGRKPHPDDIVPGTMGRMMLGHMRRVKEVAADRGLTVPEVNAQIRKMRVYL